MTGDPFLGYPADAADVAAVSIAAVLAWRMPTVATRFTPLTATASMVTYLQLTTPALPAGGVWSMTLGILTGGAAVASGTDVEIQLVRDIGTGGEFTFPGPLAEFGVALGRFANSFPLVEPLAAGVHTYDVQIAQPSGPGSFDAINSLMSFERWA